MLSEPRPPRATVAAFALALLCMGGCQDLPRAPSDAGPRDTAAEVARDAAVEVRADSSVSPPDGGLGPEVPAADAPSTPDVPAYPDTAGEGPDGNPPTSIPVGVWDESSWDLADWAP